MFRALAVIAAFALLVYALADFANSDERDRGGIPGWLWIVIIVLLPYFGPLAWIVFSRSRRSQGGRAGGPSLGAPKSRRRPSGPLAPDDDPEFLWRLAREQQRQAGRPAAPGIDDEAARPSATRPDRQASPGQASDHTTGQTSPAGASDTPSTAPSDHSSQDAPPKNQKPRTTSHDESDTTPDA